MGVGTFQPKPISHNTKIGGIWQTPLPKGIVNWHSFADWGMKGNGDFIETRIHLHANYTVWPCSPGPEFTVSPHPRSA